MIDFILLNIHDIIPNWAKTTLMVVLIIAVFYFFLIKPQTDQSKKEKAYRKSLQRGDKAMTLGGVHVTILSVDGGKTLVEAAPGVRMKVQTSTLQPIPERPKPKEEKR